MQNQLVGVASKEMQHVRFHAFAWQLMGEAPRTYAWILQISEVEMSFATKV